MGTPAFTCRTPLAELALSRGTGCGGWAGVQQVGSGAWRMGRGACGLTLVVREGGSRGAVGHTEGGGLWGGRAGMEAVDSGGGSS